MLHVVPSPELAVKAERAGVDALIAESHEAGGHVRAGGLSTFALVPQVVDAVRLPVVAAGGIADGRGVAAALALGAQGVQIGTRFVATIECEAHDHYKRALVDAGPEDGVIYSNRDHASRGLATPIVNALIELEQSGASVEELRALRGRHRARLGCVDGVIDEGICPAGAGVGLVRDTPAVSAVIDALLAGARRALRELEETVDGIRCSP